MAEGGDWSDWAPTDYVSGTTYSQELTLGGTQGEIQVQFRVEDKLGNSNAANPVTRSFYYDYQDPVITETDSVAEYKNEVFTLKGTAYDTYKLGYIEVKDTTANNKVYRSDSGTNTKIKLFTGETETNDITTAVTAESAITWKLAFTDDDWTGFSEGSHKFLISAYDVSGRQSNIVTKSVWVDKSVPEISTAAVPDIDATEGVSFKFNGTAHDKYQDTTKDSGVKDVYIQVADSDTNTDWIKATGTTAWNQTIVFSEHAVFNKEGPKVLRVKAFDDAGNESTVYTKNFVYDKASPTLSVATYTPSITVEENSPRLDLSQTGLKAEFNVNGNFSLSGTSSDGYGIASVVVTQQINGGTEKTIQTLTGDQVSSWNITGLPRDETTPANTTASGNIASGKYTYVVTVTDNSGKTASRTVEATIDKTAPTIEIDKPTSDTSNIGENSINVVSFRFSGSAADSGTGATGVEKIWYKIIKQSDTSSITAAPTSNTTEDSTWEGLGFKKANGDTNWDFSQAINAGISAEETGNIYEGSWKLIVYAVDKAGNVGNIGYADDDTEHNNPISAVRTFDVDMAAPAIETRLDSALLDESMTQTKTGTYSFKYKVTETNGVPTTVLTMKKDNVVFEGFTQSDPENDYITVSISSQADALYEYTISATDAVGKNTTIKRNILLDTTPPTVKVVSPDLTAWQSSANVTINGSSEDKSGTLAVWYKFGVESIGTYPTDPTQTIDNTKWSGWTQATGTTSWSIPLENIVDGTQKKLYIAAVDTNGAVTTSFMVGSETVSNATVKVDLSDPILSETTIGAGKQYTNASFTLSGTASDGGSGLESVVIKEGNDTIETLTSSSENVTVNGNGWTWTSSSITPSGESTHTYTITATDNAGRKTTESRTVVYDKSLPSVPGKSVSTAIDSYKTTVGTTDWYRTTQIPVVITASDTGSGVVQVEASTNNSDWTILGSGENAGEYTGYISCTSQGVNTVYVKVTDRAGNIFTTTAAEALKVNVDTLNPTVTLHQVGGAALTGTKLVTGGENVIFSVTAADDTDGSGLAETSPVKLTKIGGTTVNQAANFNESTGKYEMTISTTNMTGISGTVDIKVSVSDNAGNSTEITAFQLQKDDEYPSAQLGGIVDADTTTEGIVEVNGVITISGTTSDNNNELVSIKLQYQTSENGTTWGNTWTDYVKSGTDDEGNPFTAKTSHTGSLYNWSYSIDTKTAFGNDFDDKYVRFRAVATDKAGNSGNSGTTTAAFNLTEGFIRTIKVSQKTDRPVIRITSDFDMDGMAAGTPVWFTDVSMFGTVSDDDGTIKSLKAIAKNVTTSGETLNVPTESEWTAKDENNNDIIPNLYKNGSWTFKFDSDGEKQIFFRVVDASGTIFISRATSLTAMSLSAEQTSPFGPKIIDYNDQDTDDLNGNDILFVKVDYHKPTLQKLYYYESATEIVANNFGTITAWTEVTSAFDKTFGGTKKYLYIKYEGKDQNGIDSMEASITGTGVIKKNEILTAHDDEGTMESIAYFDISKIAKTAKLEITITDKSGSESLPISYNLTIDNDAPIIRYSYPTNGSQVYGTSSVTLRGTTDDNNPVTRLDYKITKSATPAPTVSDSGWTEITDTDGNNYTSTIGWQITFDGDVSKADTSSYHSNKLSNTVFDLYSTEVAAAGGENSYNTTSAVYIWIRATDELGSSAVNETAYHLNVVPNADIPVVNITYPDPTTNTGVGGTIRITGTTEINDKDVSEVYIQIDPSYDANAGFNVAETNGWADELDALIRDGEGNLKAVGYSIVNVDSITVDGETVNIASKIPTGKGIKVQGNSKYSWSLSINKQKEVNEPIEGLNRVIGIRAYAVSTSGKVSESTVVVCNVDAEAPVFGQSDELRFIQIDAAGNEISSRRYESGIFLKGQWYLVGSITDENGIGSVIIDGTEYIDPVTHLSKGLKFTDPQTNAEVEYITSTTNFVGESASSKGYSNFNLKIPVGNIESGSHGKIEYKIEAKEGDGADATGTLEFTIYYDNKKPTFAAQKGNGFTLKNLGETLGAKETSTIEQSNGSYLVKGIFEESASQTANQSGFERIALFFTRTYPSANANTKNLYLIDPMVANNTNGNTEGKGNFVKLGTLTTSTVEGEEVVSFTAENNSGFVQKEGLYWSTSTATKLENSNELTVDSNFNAKKNVRIGGLCMVDNVIYRIDDIDGTKIKLKGTLVEFNYPDNLTSPKTVYFAFAQIIDNEYPENTSTTVYDESNKDNNGDGDWMYERANYKGNDHYDWEVKIDSSNMLDGLVDMNFVAYDVAGNYAEQALSQRISNNAPRIAGITYGADNNLDGYVTGAELRTLYTYKTITSNGIKIKDPNDTTKIGEDEDGERITSYTVPSQLIVKGAMQVKPEIVGGNGGLGWQYEYSEDGTNYLPNTQTPTEYTDAEHSDDGEIRSDDLTIRITLKEFLQKNIASGEQNMKFIVWDMTDGSTLGDVSSGSAKATITIPVNVTITDEDPPTAVVDPFFWKGKDNNSIYKNNTANGHIELEDDWKLTSTYTTNANATEENKNPEYDGDAKVSGMITFVGTATDNISVQKITAKIPGYDPDGEGTSYAAGDEFVIAQRDSSITAPATLGWTSANLYYEDESGQPVTSYTYNDGTQDVTVPVNASASLIGKNAVDWVFEPVSDVYDDDDNGKNTVKFYFHFNTEKIATSAATDVAIQFTAYDKGSPALADENDVDEDGDGIVYKNERNSTPGNVSTASTKDENNKPILTGCYKVDVVPYIAKVYTQLAALKKNNWSVFNRTALGHYPVALKKQKSSDVTAGTDETIYLYGFNLGNASYQPVYNLVSLAAPTNGKDDQKVDNKSVRPYGNDYATYKVVTFPVINVSESGGIELSVNGVITLNNKNYDDAHGGLNGYTGTNSSVTGDKSVYENYYNRQPNDDTNNLLTDDVILDLWEIDPKAVQPINGYATQPVMAINPANHDVGFAFVNGTLYYSMPYGKTSNQTSYQHWIGGYDFWTAVGLAYDSKGFAYGTAAGGDIADNRADTFRIMTSRWGYCGRDTQGYDNGSNNYRLEYIAQADYDSAGNCTRNFNKERVRSPSLVATNASATEATVYLAYYDEINDEIRFKWGTISNTNQADWYTNRKSDAQKATFFGDYYGTVKNSNKSESNGKNTLEGHNGDYRLTHNSLIAGQTTNKYTKARSDGEVGTTDLYTMTTAVMTNEEGEDGNPVHNPVYAGKYVSIAAIENGGTSDDAVIAVWWDAENSQLLYSYNLTPKSIQVGQYSQADTKWSTPVAVFGEGNGIGEYCKIATIKEGSDGNAHYSVHIAAYDSLSGDLWYAYIPNFANPTSGVKTCIVDSYGIVGTELNIDVAVKDGIAVPYISYYAGSCARPKLAYWAKTESIANTEDISGAIDEVFTGMWEISVIPTVSKVSVDHINVGVWKTSGLLNYSTNNGEAPTQNNSNIGTNSFTKGTNGYGKVWGNGSKNPVLGYAITKGSNGYIETAQMR